MPKYVDIDKLPVKQICIGGPMLGRFIGVVYADDIAAAPAADVATVVHGRWVEYHIRAVPSKRYKCSSCGNGAFDSNFVYGARYCPICGARMDKEEQHD